MVSWNREEDWVSEAKGRVCDKALQGFIRNKAPINVITTWRWAARARASLFFNFICADTSLYLLSWWWVLAIPGRVISRVILSDGHSRGVHRLRLPTPLIIQRPYQLRYQLMLDRVVERVIKSVFLLFMRAASPLMLLLLFLIGGWCLFGKCLSIAHWRHAHWGPLHHLLVVCNKVLILSEEVSTTTILRSILRK